MSVGLDRAGVVAVTGGRSERTRTVVYQQSASGDYRSVPGVATDGLPLPAWAHLDPEELPGVGTTVFIRGIEPWVGREASGGWWWR